MGSRRDLRGFLELLEQRGQLRRISALPDTDGQTGFSLGLLHAAEEEREMSLRHDFVRLWPSVVQVHKKTSLD